jgi:phage terminase small subunit
MALNDKQQRFVAEYLVDLNATQAAIRAGYSEKTARTQASELLTKPDIEAAIAKGKARQLATTELSAVRVLEEYRRVAFSNVRDYFDDAGRLKPLKDLPAAVTASLASIKTTKKNLTAGDGVQEDVVEVRLWDKTRALNDLARHFALLVDRVEVAGHVSLLMEKIQKARARGAALREQRSKGK